MFSFLSKKTPVVPANENADPIIAMQEACDAHGEFKTNPDGTLQFEDYKVLRAIILR